MVLLRVKHPMKYSEKDYNGKRAECPAGMSISQAAVANANPMKIRKLIVLSPLGLALLVLLAAAWW